jgi:L-alanine-DL-glutamate epimerase-like enolase superfamily enzyme
VLEREAADVIVLGHHECGGLWRMRELAGTTNARGLPFNRHAVMESELSTCAALQVMSAIPNLTLGNQAMHQLLAESLVRDAVDATAGRIRVPDAPGLGIELDPDAVARAHERYAEHGPYRSVEPTLAGGLRWR